METNMPEDLVEKDSPTNLSLTSEMVSSNVLNDHLSSEVASDMDSSVIKKACTKEHLLFLLTMALATFLRFYRLPSLPMGFNPDEASTGYEALALFLHGTDRWGNKFPIYFPAWGSGQSVLIAYLNIPFIKIFGLTTLGVRLSSVLLSLLTIVIFYAFIKKWYGTRTALIAAFVLATNPWHIVMSRWAIDCNLLPFFLLLGVTSLSYCYTSQYSKILIPFSLFFLALSFYTYAITIFIIPTFLVLYFLLVDLGTLWRNKLGVLVSLLIFFLITSPFFLFILDNYVLHRTPTIVQHLPFSVPLLIGSRFDQIGGGHNAFAANTQFLMNGFRDGFIWNMAGDYSPLGLLSLSLASILGISLSSLGILSIPLSPALGMYYSLRKRNLHANVFLILFIAIIPIFFIYTLTINRANAIFIPLIALSAIGISGLSRSISNKDLKMIVVSLILAAVTLSNSMFCVYYFTNYNNDSKDASNAGLDIALTQAKSSADANEPIYVSNRVQVAYIYVLLFLKIDPVDFRKHSRILVSNGTYQVVSYRNYYFDPDETELRSVPSFVALLKDGEGLSCENREILYSEDIWTVERCFN